MADPRFVHLHCHSHYSLLDGAGKIDDLLSVTAEHGMDAIALTDHGNMFGAIEFYKKARDKQVKPIIGYEAYVSPGARGDTKTRSKRGKAYYHQTLLAASNQGYENLIKLASLAYTEGFYVKPRIDLEALEAYSEGVICLSGCLASEVCQSLMADDREAAERAIDRYLEIYGDRYYIELQYNGIQEQLDTSLALMEIADRKGLPCVLTNDVHYPTKACAKVHDVLLCIQTGKQLDDPSRMKFETDEFYIKSPREMAQVFPDRADALANTVEVAERCDVELVFNDYHLPPFVPPQQKTVDDYFRELCIEGLKERYGDPLPPEIMPRFEEEAQVIISMGFPTYFLITADFIAHARSKGISVGPGRGSAAGSIIAYALKITNIDPLKYDLIFERFLNAGRNELPDIDIDFDAARRGEVIDYVVEKYGRENVCQIVTFGKIQAKLGIRDVGRVLGKPVVFCDRIAKLIPDTPGISIDEALEQEPDLRELYNSDGEVREVIDIAKGVEGLVRQTGVHAAGVIIADAPVSNYAPLAVSKDGITTQYPMEQCEQIGLLKMDFLGLRNLTIIEETLDLVALTTGEPRIDIDAIPLDDKLAFDLLSAGDTRGIFQLESSGMRELLTHLRPDCFEDVIALVALYRPGPLGSGMDKVFIKRKHGEEKVEVLHPMIEETLADTYGVILYQEQVMRIANLMGGFSLSDADRLRKAMGKKKLDLMAKFKIQFVEGAVAQNVDKKLAGNVYDLMAEFAKYGFNKSHSAAYALVAYQTAYLKARYRTEFMAALVSCNSSDSEKLSSYLDECRSEGIEILAPSVNSSLTRFSVEDGKIRFGLGAIKKAGAKAVQALIDERKSGGEFRDLYDLCTRIDSRQVNKGVLERLVAAGACDGLGGHRAQQTAALEAFIRSGQKDGGRLADQLGLFDDLGEEDIPDPELPTVPVWTDRELLQQEKAALGLYLSGHPLAPYAAKLKTFATATTDSLGGLDHRASVRIGGLISRLRPRLIKNGRNAGRKFASFMIEDLEGSCEGVCFPDTYDQYAELLAEDALVFVAGEVDTAGPETSIIVNELMSIDDIDASFTGSVVIHLQPTRHPQAKLEELRTTLRTSRGDVPVYLEVKLGAETAYLSTADDLKVSPTNGLAEALGRVVGFDGYTFKASAAKAAEMTARSSRNGRGKRRG